MVVRTPRRAAHKRTPYKQRTQEVPEQENTLPNSNLIDLIKYYKEKEEIREEYINALKAENTHLRNSLVVPDQSVFTGMTISRVEDTLYCKQTIEKDGVVCSLSFY